jgi:hypothetical protein
MVTTKIIDSWARAGSMGRSTAEVNPPATVKAVPRFASDIQALQMLMHFAEPPLRKVRCRRHGKVHYGFGDASSGPAFGASFDIDDYIHYQYGQWTMQVTEEELSNWRELSNLVQALKKITSDCGLHDCEIIIFTDNTTAEGAFWKRTVKSPKLFELVLELKML